MGPVGDWECRRRMCKKYCCFSGDGFAKGSVETIVGLGRGRASRNSLRGAWAPSCGDRGGLASGVFWRLRGRGALCRDRRFGCCGCFDGMAVCGRLPADISLICFHRFSPDHSLPWWWWQPTLQVTTTLDCNRIAGAYCRCAFGYHSYGETCAICYTESCHGPVCN